LFFAFLLAYVMAATQPLHAATSFQPSQEPPNDPPIGAESTLDESATRPDFSALPELAVAAVATPVEPPPAPLLIAPADGAQTTGLSHPPLGLPTLIWQPVSTPANYHVQLANNDGFSNAVDLYTYSDRYSTGVSNGDVPMGWVDGDYYWRVQAIVRVGATTLAGPYSPVWRFTRDWDANGALVPQPLSPAADATLNAFREGAFTWTPVAGAARYIFQISTSELFSPLIYSAETTSTTHTPRDRLPSNRYFWRLIPVDNRGRPGLPSQARTFVFDWSAPPVMLAPPDNLEAPFAPRFSWTAVEGAKYYLLQISTSKTFDAVATRTYSTYSTDFTPLQALSNDQEYFWRVRALTDVRAGAVEALAEAGTPWSLEDPASNEPRSFKIKWNFAPVLLTPTNLARVSYPTFSWEPVPGAERYQIQIDEGSSLVAPLVADVKVYNVPAWAQPRYDNGILNQYYSWHVRAIDAQNNTTPYSTMRSFAAEIETAPNYVYPPFRYTRDAANMPVSQEVSIAWPVFVWDTAHVHEGFPINSLGSMMPPHHYRLTIDDNDSFASPNVIVDTCGLAAALTSANTIEALTPGARYFWKVQAFAQAASTAEVGASQVWEFVYNPDLPELPFVATPTLIYPADRFDAVGDPPVLGWLPVTGAVRYQVQVAADVAFTQIADESIVAGVHYVPWQGRMERMPTGPWWWRVQPLNGAGSPIGAPSEIRRFHLSIDVPTLNPFEYTPITCTGFDKIPPCSPSTQASSVLATTPNYKPIESLVATGAASSSNLGLGELHMFGDRVLTESQNWVIAFKAAPSVDATVTYSLYLDIDHIENSGGSLNPVTSLPIPLPPLFWPEYIVNVTRVGNTIDATNVEIHEWNAPEQRWNARKRLSDILGQALFDATPGIDGVQLAIPYTALGAGRTDFSGSFALVLASSAPGVPVGDTIPPQGATFARPAFVSDMVMPLYPFDMPFTNPSVYQDMQTLRWRTPYFDSTDGYQVEVARDARFTDIVEPWETVEAQTSPYFQLLPAAMQTSRAYGDNESYYWRVRIRHERFNSLHSDFYDYSAWSPPMRFKLDSRLPGNPHISTGEDAFMTPTFLWDRVEGVAGYALEIDNDANFSSPLFSVHTDSTSYTPNENLSAALAPGVQYFWHVAIRRSDTILGHWTERMSFMRTSVAPLLIAPADGAQIFGQPTLVWTPILTPTVTPRLAAARYRLQVDNDNNFGSPAINETTQATMYTPVMGKNLADGTWYWRVALVDAAGRDGPFSLPRQFTRRYATPTLVAPAQGAQVNMAPTIVWQPIDGAAYYKVEYATNDTFRGSMSVYTDNSTYTPTAALKTGYYYWRVQMYDDDGKPGPELRGNFQYGWKIQLPIVHSPK
jgi:hypothetical protein